jgi:hypothetical protein
MSEPLTNHGQSTAEFEQQDLKPVAVYAFLGGLVVAGIVIYFVLWGLYHVLDAYQRRHQPPQSPLVQQAPVDTRVIGPAEITKFPQPRLERNERTEIGEFRLQEEQQLDTYGWVDQQAGVVHIPIERAMQLLVKQGLPTTPRVGTIPPSEVNVVKEAAERADTSNLPEKKKQK